MTYHCTKHGVRDEHCDDAAVTSALAVILDLLAQSRTDADDSMDRLTTDLERLLEDPMCIAGGSGQGEERGRGGVRTRIISEVQFYDLLVQRIQRIHGCLEIVRDCLSDHGPISKELERKLGETVRFFHESPPPARDSEPDDVVLFFDDLTASRAQALFIRN